MDYEEPYLSIKKPSGLKWKNHFLWPNVKYRNARMISTVSVWAWVVLTKCDVLSSRSSLGDAKGSEVRLIEATDTHLDVDAQHQQPLGLKWRDSWDTTLKTISSLTDIPEHFTSQSPSTHTYTHQTLSHHHTMSKQNRNMIAKIPKAL